MSFSLGKQEGCEVLQSVNVTQHINRCRGNGNTVNSVDVE